MKENIQVDWSPKEVDRLLQDKHKISLYHFIVSLDDIFSEHDKRTIKLPKGTTGHLTRWREFWHDNIQLLDKLKTYNRNSLDILNKFNNETSKYLDPLIDPYVRNEDFHLVINDISKSIEIYKEIIENLLLDSKTRRGGVEEKKNIVFLTWSHFFKAKNKSRVDFKRIISLMNWLSSRIKLHDLKEHDLKETENSEQNFRRVLSRYRGKKPKPFLVSIVDDYKERFLVPIQHNWLEQGIAGYELDEPLITFSNGEKLTPKDFIMNNPEYESDIEPAFFSPYDFRDSKNEDPLVFFPEDEDGRGEVTNTIDRHLMKLPIPDDPDS